MQQAGSSKHLLPTITLMQRILRDKPLSQFIPLTSPFCSLYIPRLFAMVRLTPMYKVSNQNHTRLLHYYAE